MNRFVYIQIQFLRFIKLIHQQRRTFYYLMSEACPKILSMIIFNDHTLFVIIQIFKYLPSLVLKNRLIYCI